MRIPFGPKRRAWQETISNWAAQGNDLLVSPPAEDPAQSYPQTPRIQAEDVQLPSSGLSDAQREEALRRMLEYLKPQTDCFMGYQVNQALQYEDDLKSFLNVNINNIGDPFVSGNMTNNTKVMERAVLDYYASLWNAKWPHNPNDPDSYWGYVLSMAVRKGSSMDSGVDATIWRAADCWPIRFFMIPRAGHRRQAVMRPFIPWPSSRTTFTTRS